LTDLIILIKPGEEYKSRSSSLCSFLHSPITSSLFGPIFSSAPCSQTPSVYVALLMLETKFHTHTEPQAKLVFRIFKSLYFVTVYEKTKYSELNDSKHYQNLVCSRFPGELNFDLLLSFPNIWTVSHY
jgi:hypothetical protein